ncbi:MAG: hypothetical protein FWB97_02870 [Oscillospiraceae bacterium]|nr:hypothetical protein [Oscillospiraceae bacterium]
MWRRILSDFVGLVLVVGIIVGFGIAVHRGAVELERHDVEGMRRQAALEMASPGFAEAGADTSESRFFTIMLAIFIYGTVLVIVAYYSHKLVKRVRSRRREKA